MSDPRLMAGCGVPLYDNHVSVVSHRANRCTCGKIILQVQTSKSVSNKSTASLSRSESALIKRSSDSWEKQQTSSTQHHSSGKDQDGGIAYKLPFTFNIFEHFLQQETASERHKSAEASDEGTFSKKLCFECLKKQMEIPAVANMCTIQKQSKREPIKFESCNLELPPSEVYIYDAGDEPTPLPSSLITQKWFTTAGWNGEDANRTGSFEIGELPPQFSRGTGAARRFTFDGVSPMSSQDVCQSKSESRPESPASAAKGYSRLPPQETPEINVEAIMNFINSPLPTVEKHAKKQMLHEKQVPREKRDVTEKRDVVDNEEKKDDVRDDIEDIEDTPWGSLDLDTSDDDDLVVGTGAKLPKLEAEHFIIADFIETVPTDENTNTFINQILDVNSTALSDASECDLISSKEITPAPSDELNYRESIFSSKSNAVAVLPQTPRNQPSLASSTEESQHLFLESSEDSEDVMRKLRLVGQNDVLSVGSLNYHSRLREEKSCDMPDDEAAAEAAANKINGINSAGTDGGQTTARKVESPELNLLICCTTECGDGSDGTKSGRSPKDHNSDALQHLESSDDLDKASIVASEDSRSCANQAAAESSAERAKENCGTDIDEVSKSDEDKKVGRVNDDLSHEVMKPNFSALDGVGKFGHINIHDDENHGASRNHFVLEGRKQDEGDELDSISLQNDNDQKDTKVDVDEDNWRDEEASILNDDHSAGSRYSYRSRPVKVEIRNFCLDHACSGLNNNVAMVESEECHTPVSCHLEDVVCRKDDDSKVDNSIVDSRKDGDALKRNSSFGCSEGFTVFTFCGGGLGSIFE